MPNTGHARPPCTEPASSVPTNGPVHANEARANTRPITSTPAVPPRLESRSRDVSAPLGTVISKTPNRLTAKTAKIKAMNRFTQTLDPNCTVPKGPRITETSAPSPVKQMTMPAQNVRACTIDCRREVLPALTK